jgi:putative sterol carrier protein
MTTAPVRIDGPAAEDTRRAHPGTLEALGAAVARTAALWRRVDTPDAPVPGLRWTAAETAAHVVGDLRDYAQALTRHANGYLTHINPQPESPSRRSEIVNARHLAEVTERAMDRLADMLEETADNYLAVAGAANTAASIPTPNGLVISPSTMTCLLLGEQLVHGLDIARAAKAAWAIDRGDAVLVLPGALTVMPEYLRPARAADLRVSFELRIRAASSYRMTIDNGSAVVTAAGEKVDCTITADPVAFLLLGYGRIGQWNPTFRGKLRAGGRKPWLAMKFGTLFYSP